MQPLLIILAPLVILAGAATSFKRTRDPLSPAVVLAPMLFYLFVVEPIVLILDGTLDFAFPNPNRLFVPCIYTIAALIAFEVGLVPAGFRRHTPRGFQLFDQPLTLDSRTRLRQIAYTLGFVSAFVFWSMIWESGGVLNVIATEKPYLSSPINSGYYKEMTKLAYIAVLVFALSLQQTRLLPKHVFQLVIIGHVPLVLSTVLARRGPLILSILTFAAAWCLARMRRPSLRVVVVGLCATGVLILLLGEHRNRLFQPWLWHQIDLSTALDFEENQPSLGATYVTGAAWIIGSNEHSHHFWGKHIATVVFVRPIPRQLWPTQYEDIGMEWMRTSQGTQGLADSEWYDSVGFVPLDGTFGGFIADLFIEFSWLGIFGAFLLGRFHGWAWSKWSREGGGWMLLYLLCLILAVYLIAQGLGEWLYKLILLGGPGWMTWTLVKQSQFARGRSATIWTAGDPAVSSLGGSAAVPIGVSTSITPASGP